jgi:transcription-repair coupling factor (superfamily II helicase)
LKNSSLTAEFRSGAPLRVYDARILAELAAGGLDLLFVARDDVRLAQTSEAVAFFAPDVERLEFPAWDCLPYDRVSRTPNRQPAHRHADSPCWPSGRTRVLPASC